MQGECVCVCVCVCECECECVCVCMCVCVCCRRMFLPLKGGASKPHAALVKPVESR